MCTCNWFGFGLRQSIENRFIHVQCHQLNGKKGVRNQSFDEDEGGDEYRGTNMQNLGLFLLAISITIYRKL